MKKKILTFFMTLLILITNLSTPVFGFNSYEEYYNTTYLYSLKIPKDIKNVVMDSNLSVVTIPYEDQIRLEIHVEKVENFIGEDVLEKNNIKDPDKINIKSDILENTYGNDAYMQQNAVNIAKKFTSSPTVTKVENCKIDRRNGYKIYYNSKLTGADGEELTGHGMILFTIDHGDVYYFVFTDNSLREENIDDYDFFAKAINSINLEDFDYTPFILIGILCAILYVLLMTLYLKAERRAEQRKERRRREKELKKKRSLGLEPISHDDDYEYYDEIVIEEAGEDEEVDGENVFTVEQIMKLYPSLKDIKIVSKENGTADIVTSGELNGNIIDYKEIEEDLDNKIKSSSEENKKEESENVNIGNVAAMTKIKDESEFYEFENENDVKEEMGFELVNNSENHVSKATLIDQDYDNDEESFVFEDVDEELYEAKRDKNLNLTFEQPSNKESVNVEEFGEDIENIKDENTSISEEEIFEDIFDNDNTENIDNTDEALDDVILDDVSKEEIESVYDEINNENEFEETIKEITEETDEDIADINEEDVLNSEEENQYENEDISQEVDSETKDVLDEDLEETQESDLTKEDISKEETSDDVKQDDKDFHLENEDNKEASYEEESSSIDEQDDEKLNTDNAEVLDESENVQHDALEETSDEQLEENKETEIVEEIESEESNEEVFKENDKEQEDLKDDIEETKEENEDVETQKNEALDDEVSSEEVVNTSDEETSDVEEIDEDIHENEVFDEVSNEEIESTNEVEQLEEEKQQVIDDKENDISDSEESSTDETSREINEVEEEEISSTDNMDSSLEEYTEDEQSENETDSNNIEDITESEEEKEDIDDIDISNDEDNEKSDNEEDAISKSDKKEK